MFEKNRDSRSPLHILLPLSIFFVVVILLSACGGQATDTTNPAAPDNTGTDSGNTTPDEPAPTEPAPTEGTEPEPTAEVAPTEEPAAAGVSFSADVFPIIQSRCINCHGGDRTEADLVLRSFDDLMAGSENGAVIVPGDASNSLLVKLITELEMPKRGPKLTPVQIQTITDWVNQGALNN